MTANDHWLSIHFKVRLLHRQLLCQTKITAETSQLKDIMLIKNFNFSRQGRKHRLGTYFIEIRRVPYSQHLSNGLTISWSSATLSGSLGLSRMSTFKQSVFFADR